MLPKSTNNDLDDIEVFRNVHLVEEQPGIRSVAEASEILSHDPSHPFASKYLGWSLLQASDLTMKTIMNAIQYLRVSIASDQWRDCLDALARSTRLNPLVPLVWRNIGILYDGYCQYGDALDGYEKAFELGLYDSQCRERLNALELHITQGTALPPLTLQMEDFDANKTTCETHELEEVKNDSIELAALRLENERASDGWRISGDKDGDFESDLENDI
ncbi:MAG: hypothetical protein Q9195_008402 [Heterodermia aff. obscurata]